MDSAVVTAITTAFTGAADSVESLVATFVPIAASVAVAGIGLKFGPKIIKRITSWI